MRIIIFDHLGCHAAVLAGSYLAGLLGPQSSVGDILKLPYFGVYEDVSPGRSFFLGRDKYNNEIYTLGVGHEAGIMTVSAHDLLKILNCKDRVRIIDVSVYNNFLVRSFIYLGLFKPFSGATRFLCACLLKCSAPKIFKLLEQQAE